MRTDAPLRRGQALMELAVGMFALALVVSALCGFAVYIAKSLKMQNALREGNGGISAKIDRVEVGAFASEYLFGRETLVIREKVTLPERTIIR